jgi:hypothetical protein
MAMAECVAVLGVLHHLLHIARLMQIVGAIAFAPGAMDRAAEVVETRDVMGINYVLRALWVLRVLQTHPATTFARQSKLLEQLLGC